VGGIGFPHDVAEMRDEQARARMGGATGDPGCEALNDPVDLP